MKLEKVVLAVGGTSMVIGGLTGVLGLVTDQPTLKAVAACALGFGVIVGCVPLVILIAATVLAKKGGGKSP